MSGAGMSGGAAASWFVGIKKEKNDEISGAGISTFVSDVSGLIVLSITCEGSSSSCSLSPSSSSSRASRRRWRSASLLPVVSRPKPRSCS